MRHTTARLTTLCAKLLLLAVLVTSGLSEYVLLGPRQTWAAQVTLAWDAARGSDLAGYIIYYGNASGSYDAALDIGMQTMYTLSDLEDGRAYHFAVTAYDIYGNESAFSNEAVLP